MSLAKNNTYLGWTAKEWMADACKRRGGVSNIWKRHENKDLEFAHEDIGELLDKYNELQDLIEAFIHEVARLP